MNRRQFIISGTVAGSYVALMRPDITSLLTFNRERLGLGLIGLGTRGIRRLEDVRASSLVNVKAICDVDEKRLNSALARVNKSWASLNILGTRDAGRIFEDPEIKAVAIAASGSATPGLIRQASKAGKHVLVEAPWAPSVSESAAIAAMAGQSSNTIHQGTYDPDWDDDYFDNHVASAQKNVTFAHLSIAIGATDTEIARPVLFEGVDLLGATTRWLGAGSSVNITSISSGHPFGDSAAVRFDFPSGEGQQIVMSIFRTPQLSAGEFQGTIETRTRTGQEGIFKVLSQSLSSGDAPISKSLIRFVDLSSRVLGDQASRAQRAHQINRLILSAKESLEHRRAVRLP
jgi:hypothetical protein